MSITEILFLALGLSMDAFAAALCKGLAMERLSTKKSLLLGTWFGSFQAAMPLVGWLVAAVFDEYLQSLAHYISAALLAVISIGMFREAREGGAADSSGAAMSVRAMVLVCAATSIDALAAGVTFAFVGVNFGSLSAVPAVLLACAIIGAVTLALTSIGAKAGSIFGARYKSHAQVCGGIILLLLAVMTLIEGLSAQFA